MNRTLQIYIAGIFLFLAIGCEKPTPGYLMTEDAGYALDQMTIIRLDTVTEDNNPELYAKYEDRIENKSVWVTSAIEGVLGTLPIYYSVDHVEVIGMGDADIFMQEVSMMGGGRLVFPFSYQSPKGLYAVSVRVENEGYSKVIKDIFYISIE